MNSQQIPRCPKCGGRLFLESEHWGNRLLYFWECSLGCSRQFELGSKLLRYKAEKHCAQVVRETVLVG